MSDIPEGSKLFLSDRHGQFIPQVFAETVNRNYVEGVTDEQWDTLESGPEEEWYWDVWISVEANARITDPDTDEVYVLYQDGDLWLVPEDAEWTDEV